MDDDLLTCQRCERELPEDAFAYCAHRGRQRWCRSCMTDYQRERRQTTRGD